MKIQQGYGGGWYLVFDSEWDAEDYNTWMLEMVGETFRYCCFGGFMNALELPSTSI